MSNHARLSPSNHRWVHCPGSVREEAEYPNISNLAAIDGTGSHLLLEKVLKEGGLAKDYLNKTIGINHSDKLKGWLVDQNRIDRVQMAVSYVERRLEELQKEYSDCTLALVTEEKTNPGMYFGRPDWWGTCDIVILVMRDFTNIVFIEVIDYKDGQIRVDEKNNSQLIAYLTGQIFKYNLNGNCRMTIVQPKTKPPIRYENSHSSKIRLEADKLAKAATLTGNPDALLIADDKQGNGYCKWCKHRGNCKALKEKINSKVNKALKKTENLEGKKGELVMDTIQDKGIKNFKDFFNNINSELTNQKSAVLSEFLNIEKFITDVFKKVKEEVEIRLKNGEKVPGYEMLPGNNKKVWAVDEDEVYKLLKNRKLAKDEIYIPKFISPAQVLKHKTLTDKQKEMFADKCIKTVPGDLKLTKVNIKEIETEETNNLDVMFKEIQIEESKEVKNIEFVNPEEISFL